MITIQEITKKLEHLPSDKLLVIFEFIDFLEQKGKKSIYYNEMSNMEIIIAAEKTGSFDYLNDPSNDIYTIEDGEPL
ncbi:MAG: hypothetical protein ABRQ39_20155 [Candidatus Eremiobacterota bacterium]